MEKKFKRVPVDVAISDLTPLNISCTTTKCDEELHCFKTGIRAAKKFGKEGVCKECGTDLIDWKRVHRNDINDSKFIFESMKNELIRHVYWHTDIQEEAITRAIEKGELALRDHARKLIKSKIGNEKNVWDGRQTPMTGGEIVNYAQHATATCCRKCLEYWHNIKSNEKLTSDQLEFCTDLAMLYIKERIPNLD